MDANKAVRQKQTYGFDVNVQLHLGLFSRAGVKLLKLNGVPRDEVKVVQVAGDNRLQPSWISSAHNKR